LQCTIRDVGRVWGTSGFPFCRLSAFQCSSGLRAAIAFASLSPCTDTPWLVAAVATDQLLNDIAPNYGCGLRPHTDRRLGCVHRLRAVVRRRVFALAKNKKKSRPAAASPKSKCDVFLFTRLPEASRSYAAWRDSRQSPGRQQRAEALRGVESAREHPRRR